MRSSLLTRQRALVAARDVTYLRYSTANPSILAHSSAAPCSSPVTPLRQTPPPNFLCRSPLSTRQISSSTRNAPPSSAAAEVPPITKEEEEQQQQQQAGGKESSSSKTKPTAAATKETVGPTHYPFFPETLPQGPPPDGPFVIDTRALRREFLALQSRAHPDLASHSEKSSAQALSARINEAYKVLSSPLLRAQYLLHLKGEDAGLGEKGKTDDPELLMEVLETHHAIEDAESETELEGIRAENEGRIRESEGRLEGFFKRDEMAEAREEAVRLKYWVAVREKIHEWEVEKGKDEGKE
ncbi:Co-chaperone Hsc20 [Zalerion maritima]|uniref:Co-chaperone Hsc20 n=1 Tax=Zalerion maritima TaxID=339359 RepID=A0AAD5WM82_9PEZI|nr:Co-chaperone Hsc20 [Zalerion maritima]